VSANQSGSVGTIIPATVITIAILPVAFTIIFVAAVPPSVMSAVHAGTLIVICPVVSRTVLLVVGAVAVRVPVV